jgi:hypothetical protein
VNEFFKELEESEMRNAKKTSDYLSEQKSQSAKT